MSYEVWLSNNRRVYTLAVIPAAMLMLGGAVVVSFSWTANTGMTGAGLLLGGAGLGLLTWASVRRPRLAYAEGHLLVYVHGRRPVAVPIELVECFFLGQGPSRLPATLEGRQGEAAVAATIVVRLAEAAEEWHHRDVDDSLAQWCEGYIILRGTWCEPISPQVVGRLNKRLVETHRARKQALSTAVSV